MLAKELISDEIPPLKTSDTGLKALGWMEEFRVSHLPIVNETEFLGLISESDILDMNEPEEPIGNHKLSLIRPYVEDDRHYYDMLGIISAMNLSLIPVLDQSNNYLGCVTLHRLVEEFANMSGTKEPGGLIVLELNINDYHLSEIARIVESNDAKILSLYITSPPDSMKLEVTLKINRTDLSSILQTFSRFDYIIKASFHKSEFDEDTKTRFDSFMNYLNM
jgi:acetoin utilization protein AcuB